MGLPFALKVQHRQKDCTLMTSLEKLTLTCANMHTYVCLSQKWFILISDFQSQRLSETLTANFKHGHKRLCYGLLNFKCLTNNAMFDTQLEHVSGLVIIYNLATLHLVGNNLQFFHFAFIMNRLYVWVIDQVWGQDGWILAKFFFACLCSSRSINLQKKGGQYPAILTKQTWSMKDLLYGFWGNFACGTQQVVPSGQDGSILPARVANHSVRFGSSCSITELAI